MGAAHPVRWAEGKRDKFADLLVGPFEEWTCKALEVCLPGVPFAGPVGFVLNGDPWNTTGWHVGDQKERDEASAKGRFPFKNKDPRDPKVYGHIGSDDLHELGWYGTEGGHCPTPCATDPGCPWVKLARSEAVVKILGREAVTGSLWYGAIPDQCAVGVANLARHWRDAREDLHPLLRWPADDKRFTLWRWAMASMHWSAGGRACTHVNAYREQLVTLPEEKRWGAFMRLAAETDGGKSRHRDDEYSAIRTAQKIEGACLAAKELEDAGALEWLRDDGLSDGERAAVYARLVEVST